MIKKIYLILGLIFLLGLFLRFYRLDQNIPPLYADETGHYVIFNNLNNGSLGLIDRIVSYTFTSTWLFGLNPLGVRFFSAFYSSLIVLVGYFFARALDKKTALAYALLLAIIPWNFSIARIGHTHIPIVVLMSLLHLALYFRSDSWQKKAISLVPLLIGIYYYPSLLVMAPFVLTLPILGILQSTKLNKKYLYLGLAFSVLVIFVTFAVRYRIFDPNGRGLDLAIWRDVNVTADSNLYRGLARNSQSTIFSFYQDPEKIANKIAFNYPVSVFSAFAKNYLSFFSPDFLFLKGDQVLRHSTGMVGNFYLFLLPFMLYGILKFFSSKNSEPRTKNQELLLLWLLSSPLPAAITKDGATYLLRAVTMMPILTYFCALGLVCSFELFKSNLLKSFYGLALSLIALFSVYYYFYGYFHVYPALSADSFEYGFKELTEFQTKNPGKLLIIWDDKYPFAHFCFWQNLPFSICEFSKTNTRLTVGESRLDLPLPNVLFSLPASILNLELITKNYELSYLALPKRYKSSFPVLPKSFQLVVSIKNPDQSSAFEIYEVK